MFVRSGFPLSKPPFSAIHHLQRQDHPYTKKDSKILFFQNQNPFFFFSFLYFQKMQPELSNALTAIRYTQFNHLTSQYVLFQASYKFCFKGILLFIITITCLLPLAKMVFLVTLSNLFLCSLVSCITQKVTNIFLLLFTRKRVLPQL